MATELFAANLATTQVLSGGTDAPAAGTQETWTVASSAMFGPAATGVSQFHVADPNASSETIAVIAVSGTTWTVTRGAENTVPVGHIGGFTVYQVTTAGFLGGGVPQVYNVMGFGATGNGSTPDDAAIQSAVAAATGTGGIVWLPPGAYKLATGLLAASSVIWRGAGALKSTLRPASGVTAITAPGVEGAGPASFTATNASPCVFTLGSSTPFGGGLPAGADVTLSGGSLPAGFAAATTYYAVNANLSALTFELAATFGGTPLGSTSSGSGNVTASHGQLTQAVYEDFGIVGPGQGTGSAPGMALNWCTTGTRMSRLYVTLCGGDGIQAVNSYTVSLRDSILTFNGGNGLNAQDNINSWDLSGNTSDGNTLWGYYVMGGAASVLNCCDAETNGYGGIALLGTFSFTAEGCELENNGSSVSGQQCGIYAGAGTSPYGAAQNTTLRGNWLQGSSAADYGIVIDGAVLTEIAGNGFENNLVNNVRVTSNATATLIRHGNYITVPSGGNISDSGTHTQMLDYDSVNAVMRSSGFSFAQNAGSAATVTLEPGVHPGQLVISGAAPTFGAVLRVVNTVTGVGVPAMYVTALATTDLAYGCAYAGAGFLPFQFAANGRIGWGSGTAGTDTFLGRTATGALQVTGALGITSQVTALGLNGTGTAPSVAGVTHCTAGSASGHDMGGSFALTTDSTSTGAGTIATVTFGTPLSAAPAAVLVSMADTTAAVTPVTTVAATASGSAITIQNTAGMTASHTFRVSYFVVAS